MGPLIGSKRRGDGAAGREGNDTQSASVGSKASCVKLKEFELNES